MFLNGKTLKTKKNCHHNKNKTKHLNISIVNVHINFRIHLFKYLCVYMDGCIQQQFLFLWKYFLLAGTCEKKNKTKYVKNKVLDFVTHINFISSIVWLLLKLFFTDFILL